jgi:metal-responsive CopG/Arc/MetJ family transcriptional regulator
MLCVQTKKIEIRISPGLLEEIDEAAAQNWQTRSDYIRETLVLRLNRQNIVKHPGDANDEWQKAVKEVLAAPRGEA